MKHLKMSVLLALLLWGPTVSAETKPPAKPKSKTAAKPMHRAKTRSHVKHRSPGLASGLYVNRCLVRQFVAGAPDPTLVKGVVSHDAVYNSKALHQAGRLTADEASELATRDSRGGQLQLRTLEPGTRVHNDWVKGTGPDRGSIYRVSTRGDGDWYVVQPGEIFKIWEFGNKKAARYPSCNNPVSDFPPPPTTKESPPATPPPTCELKIRKTVEARWEDDRQPTDLPSDYRWPDNGFPVSVEHRLRYNVWETLSPVAIKKGDCSKEGSSCLNGLKPGHYRFHEERLDAKYGLPEKEMIEADIGPNGVKEVFFHNVVLVCRPKVPEKKKRPPTSICVEEREELAPPIPTFTRPILGQIPARGGNSVVQQSLAHISGGVFSGGDTVRCGRCGKPKPCNCKPPGPPGTKPPPTPGNGQVPPGVGNPDPDTVSDSPPGQTTPPGK